MSARTTSDLVRHAVRTANSARHASTTTVPKKKRPNPEHGRQIFVYNHLQTNQVVYSLTKSLNNNASLKQLPYNGKKTVPRALRKDLWHPLAQITFPSGLGAVGLSAFQKLREYRRLHELGWGDEIMKDAKGYFVKKSKRGRKICDQRANSVADMAAVLGEVSEAQDGDVPVEVEVRWKNLLDAEFAETWAPNVVHDHWEVGRNNRDLMRRRTMSVDENEQLIEGEDTAGGADGQTKEPERAMV